MWWETSQKLRRDCLEKCQHRCIHAIASLSILPPDAFAQIKSGHFQPQHFRTKAMIVHFSIQLLSKSSHSSMWFYRQLHAPLDNNVWDIDTGSQRTTVRTSLRNLNILNIDEEVMTSRAVVAGHKLSVAVEFAFLQNKKHSKNFLNCISKFSFLNSIWVNLQLCIFAGVTVLVHQKIDTAPW